MIRTCWNNVASYVCFASRRTNSAGTVATFALIVGKLAQESRFHFFPIIFFSHACAFAIFTGEVTERFFTYAGFAISAVGIPAA